MRDAGALFMVQLYVAMIWAVALLLFIGLRRLLPSRLRSWWASLARRRAWGWLIVAVSIATATVGAAIAATLANDADSLILKTASELGKSWVGINVGADALDILVYVFLIVGLLLLFIHLSWWILTKFAVSKIGKALYGTWAATSILGMMGGIAFLFGVTKTFDPYPVVTLSNSKQYFDSDTVPIFLGSDDKLYAFLLILHVKGENKGDPNKMILCIPRSELKWMAITGQEMLHPIAYHHDLKRLLHSGPEKPVPKSDQNPTAQP